MPKRKTILEFINDAEKIHGLRYDYSSCIYITTSTKLDIICRNHGIFKQSPKAHLSGSGCKKCANIKASGNLSDFISRSNKIHNFKYDYSESIYTGSNKNVIIICNKHGRFQQPPNRHLLGRGCKKCATEKYKLTTDMFIHRAIIKHGDIYDYSEVEYITAHDNVSIICKKHGQFYQIAKLHLNGRGCRLCSSENSILTNEEFISRSELIHNKAYDYSKTKYKFSDIKVIIICKKHGEFEQTPLSHLQGHGCSLCGLDIKTQKLKLTLSEFVNKANVIHNNIYIYDKVVYVNMYTDITITCPKHGDYITTPGVHIRGRGCLRCTSGRSKPELEIVKFIEYVDDQLNFEISNKKILGGLELDIYLQSLNFAIEFDGIYWHSEQRGKDKNYHLNKTDMCEKQGINLFHIFENEWKDEHKQNIWKSMIVNKIGMSHKIYARKCSIIKLTGNQSATFFDMNHLQGRGYSENCSYGLMYNGVLVSAMSFSVPRYSKSYDWELLRMCNLLGHIVVGGFSRMIKEFRRTHTGMLISYANRRFSMGNIYGTLGFQYIKNSPPSYYYHLGNNKLLHRSSFMKHKLKNKLEIFDESKTEYENMMDNGYDRIWDCGTKVYSLKL